MHYMEEQHWARHDAMLHDAERNARAWLLADFRSSRSLVAFSVGESIGSRVLMRSSAACFEAARSLVLDRSVIPLAFLCRIITAASCEVPELLLRNDSEMLILRGMGLSFPTPFAPSFCALGTSCVDMSLDSDIVLFGLFASTIVMVFSEPAIVLPDFWICRVCSSALLGFVAIEVEAQLPRLPRTVSLFPVLLRPDCCCFTPFESVIKFCG
jgi:hypothetical protein